MTDTPPHVAAWLAETVANHKPGTVDDPDRLRARAIAAAFNAAADRPDVCVWRDPSGDIVGSALDLANVAVGALKAHREPPPQPTGFITIDERGRV